VLALLPPGLAAAPPARFTRLSVEQGLSQSTVQAILQDHVGFLWLGTEEGLNRYDGYTFVVFKHDARLRHGILAEGTAFLNKPFTPDTLARKVRETLDRPHARAAR
jgi:ligand-binding sensor domain-containing protein